MSCFSCTCIRCSSGTAGSAAVQSLHCRTMQTLQAACNLHALHESLAPACCSALATLPERVGSSEASETFAQQH